MSYFISSISAAGLSEMPPVSKGDALADQHHRLVIALAPLVVQDDQLGGGCEPLATASSECMPRAAISSCSMIWHSNLCSAASFCAVSAR
jgi:hypothetical protein